MSELQPVFTVTVWLDGDDDAAKQAENFRAVLNERLREWKIEDRLIIDYSLTRTA